MKKLSLILLAFVIVFSACKKEDVSPSDSSNNSNNNNDNNNTSAYLWEFNITPKTLLAVDNSDNVYFIGATSNDEYAIYSLDKDGSQKWKTVIGNNYSSNLGLMLADNHVIVFRNDNLVSYNITDGLEEWTQTTDYYINNMAYSNNTVYTTEYSAFTDLLKIKAFSVSTGTKNWEKNMTYLQFPKISAHNNIICLSAKNTNPYPEEFGFSVFKDNGASVDSLWGKYITNGNTSVACSPHKAIFDGQGNLFFEDDASGSTIVYSYNENTGTENWNVQIKNIRLAKNLAMLYTQGKLVATFRSDDSWGIENSFAVIDASNGSVTNTVVDGIHDENLFALTGDNTIISYTQDDNGINLLKYSTDGTLLSTDKPNYIQGSILSSYNDIKINSAGNLYIAGSDKVYCATHSFTQAPSGTWALINANNANTNSIN